MVWVLKGKHSTWGVLEWYVNKFWGMDIADYSALGHPAMMFKTKAEAEEFGVRLKIAYDRVEWDFWAEQVGEEEKKDVGPEARTQ